jgi:alcohol dehydrogenase
LGSSRVDYVDADRGRLDLAHSLGANPIEGPPPERLGPYLITVDTSANPAGLACALKSLEPGGVCTSVGIYFAPETPLPLLHMYRTGVTFKTGRVNAHAVTPHILDLVQSGRLQPQRLTTRTASWRDAAEALLEPAVKVVITRDRNER